MGAYVAGAVRVVSMVICIFRVISIICGCDLHFRLPSVDCDADDDDGDYVITYNMACYSTQCYAMLCDGQGDGDVDGGCGGDCDGDDGDDADGENYCHHIFDYDAC